MARRTKEQAEQTRETLIDAAERVFHNKGVGRATLDDIANEAGMTRGAIYWHFRNKADIFTAMCDRVALPMQAMLTALAREPGDDPLGGLISNGITILRQVAEDPRTMRVFEIMMFKTERCDVVAEVMQKEADRASMCRSEMTRVLEAAKARQQLPSHLDCDLAAFAACSFMGGCIHEWLEFREFDLASRAEWLLITFFGGLRHAPPMPGA